MSLLLPAIMLIGAISQSPVRDTVADRRAVSLLEEQWRVAQQRNDTAAFARLLAPDLTFVGTSGSFRDRAGYVASRAGSWIPRATTFTLSELRIRVFGAVAVVTGRERTTGPGVTNSARFTDVWVQRAGAWRLVAVQRTDIAPP